MDPDTHDAFSRLGDDTETGVDRDHAAPGRRMILVGCPRSRTTIAQTVISLACGLVTISTNWWLTASGTWLLNGPAGEPREVTRPFAEERVTQRLMKAGVALPRGFRVEEALDCLAGVTGALGWLEKTPLHVLALDEITADVPGARFVHLVRDPGEVVASLLRRAAANPGMRGAEWQADQDHCEAIWRECVLATLTRHGQAGHLVVDSETFVTAPEAVAERVAGFAGVPYRPPEHPARVAQAGTLEQSPRAWKQDAAYPVRRIEHQDTPAQKPLQPATMHIWRQVQDLLVASDPSTTAAPRERGEESHDRS